MAAKGSRWPSFAVPRGRLLAPAATRAWWSAVEPLWVIGLALVCLLIGHFMLTGPWLGLEGKPYDWGQYLAIGVVFPSFLFGVPLLWRWRRWSTAPVIAVKWLLVLACLSVVAVFVAASMDKYGSRSQIWPVALAAVQAVLMTRPWRRDRRDPKRLAIVFVVAVVAWTVAVSLSLEVLVQPPIFLAGLVLALLLVCDAAREPEAEVRSAPVRPWEPVNLVALAFIGFMSLRTDGLFKVLGDRGAIHHWGAWVGAADLVREGGWLLWDVPSNYGFLNVLAFAVVPTNTPWQSFYLLTALASFVVSSCIFLGLRAMRPSPLNWCFALAMAIAIPMFTPTFNSDGPVTSTFIFPNWGVYRYVWCFLLVAILVWEYVTKEQSRRHAFILVAGCVAWVIGVLWSPESAFFSSGAWLPAFVMIVFRTTAASPNRWRCVIGWLALPPALFAVAIGFIMAFYATRLGHLPDWVSFFDFAQEVGINVLVVVQEPVGPGLGMLLGFCLLATSAFYAGTRGGLPTRSFGLWIGLLGAFWATNSYGYQRGITALHPVAYAALGVMLLLLARRPMASGWDAVARAAVVPLLAIVLTSPLAAVIANPLAARDAAASLATTARDGFAVEPLLPEADPSLQALMAEAGVRPDDPIVFFGDSLGNLLQPWIPSGETDGERVVVTPHWLPGHPSLALRWIPPGRGAVYTSRFIERARRGGWLIQRKTGLNSNADFNAFVSGREPWLFELLQRTHVPTRVHENADWQLVWFEYVGDRPGTARPSEAWGLFGPLPPDVVVDGRPLAGTPHPKIWTRYGTGWGLFEPAGGDRWMASGAELWIYSPENRTVSMRLTTTSALGCGGLDIGVNGAELPTRALQDGQAFETPVGLEAGWNRIEFTVAADTLPNRAEVEVAAPSGAAVSPMIGTPTGKVETLATATPAAGASAPSSSSAIDDCLGMAIERIELET